MNHEATTTLKLAGLTTTVAVIEYVGISPEMITLLVVLMVFDVITGITKRIVLGKRDITSRKLWVGIATKIFVLSLLLLLGWIFKVTTLGSEIALSLVVGAFIAAEFYSSIQNVYIMKTGKETTEYDAVSVLLKGLLGFVRNRIDNTIDTLNKK